MRAPKKNIHKTLSDIKPTLQKGDSLLLSSQSKKIKINSAVSHKKVSFKKRTSTSNSSRDTFLAGFSSSKNIPFIKIKTSSFRKKIFFNTLIIFLVVFFVSYSVFFSNFKTQAFSSVKVITNKFSETASQFSSLNFSEGKNSLSEAEIEINTLTKKAKNLGLAKAADLLGGFFPKFKNASNSLFSLEKATAKAVEVSGKLDELKENGFTYFIEGKGDKLLPLLKDIRKDLGIISNESSGLANTASLFKGDSNSVGKIISFQSDLEGLNDFLDSLISFLDYPLSRHWLVLFQNPSEMRPSGGFIGSFADISVKDGSLSDLNISDIYDPDGWIDEKIIPPLSLQTITTEWESRDANWFFDFKDSAEQVIHFLNSSKIYVERGVKFEGAIAINTEVLKSFLEVIGPIEIPEYNLTLTPENFLEKIQYEIEVKRSKDKGQPKTILKDATPIIISRFSELDLEQKEKIISSLTSHLDNKDIMFYSFDQTFQNIFEKYNIAGKVYQKPPSFVGDYLAVVNANIAGGKSDAFIEQNIFLKTEIGLDGKVSNFLTIERTHNGRNQKYSWYSAKNQDFIRILVPKNSELVKITGATSKNISPPLNYQDKGYITDEKVFQLESLNLESGKTVFSSWLTTLAGQTKDLRFEYQNPKNLSLQDGQKYLFVFDKQSGVKGGVKFDFEAPPGFKWAENNNFIFSYENPTPEKRIEIILTLEKI